MSLRVAGILVAVALIAGLGGLLMRAGEREAPVEFGGVRLTLLYATTPAERERGLANRDFLAPDEAMLFAFPKDDLYGFWMKDTRIPLDIFWLNAQGQVVSMHRDVATSTYPRVFYPAVAGRYVLETNAGFARANGIATGTALRLPKMPIVSE